MFDPVTLPGWLFILLLCMSALFLVGQFLRPLLRRIYHNRMLQTALRLDDKLQYGLAGSALFKRETWIDRLLEDDEIKAAIAESAERRNLDLLSVREEAKCVLDEIVPSFNALLYFRIGYWVARSVLRFLYWVQVGYSENVGDAPAYGSLNRHSCVVIVSNHRSNIDPFLLIYLASRQSAVSFSAGEWARGWPLKHLLHAIGFYLIRRDTKDSLYRCLLQRYVYLAVSECVPQGLFLEGGLSPDGTMQPLRFGLLNYQLKAQGRGQCQDILFIPAAINYDRIPEDRALIEQRLGNKPAFRRRNRFFSRLVLLAFLARLAGYLLPRKHKPFGYAGVKFGEPLSLRAWQEQQKVTLEDLSGTDREQAVSQLGEELASRIRGMMPVLPVAILATLLLEDVVQEHTAFELKSRAYRLITQLSTLSLPMLVPAGDESYALDQAIALLRAQKILQRKGQGRMRVTGFGVERLRYYANSIRHLLRDRGLITERGTLQEGDISFHR